MAVVTQHTAYDIKDLHRLLHDYNDEELKRIRVVPEGDRLEEGAVYIDLSAPAPKEFKAAGSLVATPGRWYVAKKDVDYQLWNRLIGVLNPERTGEGKG